MMVKMTNYEPNYVYIYLVYIYEEPNQKNSNVKICWKCNFYTMVYIVTYPPLA